MRHVQGVLLSKIISLSLCLKYPTTQPCTEQFEEIRIFIFTGLGCEAIWQLPRCGHKFTPCSSTQNCRHEREARKGHQGLTSLLGRLQPWATNSVAATAEMYCLGSAGGVPAVWARQGQEDSVRNPPIGHSTSCLHPQWLGAGQAHLCTCQPA